MLVSLNITSITNKYINLITTDYEEKKKIR